MKQYYKLTVVIMLTVIATMAFNLVFAQPPNLGSTQQLTPYELSPTTHATDKSGSGAVTNPGDAYDADWFGTYATIPLTGNVLFPPPGDISVRYLELSGFTPPTPKGFTPEWVDIKIRYTCPTTTDDQYRILYRVLPEFPPTWYILQDWVSGSAAAVSMGTDVIAQDFHDIAEPNDGIWDWTDVGNLVVRIETQMVGSNDAKSISLYEVWAGVYPAPKPPTASTAISIQPNVTMDAQVGKPFFVDVYAVGLTPPPGLQVYTINMEYDTTVLTATEIYSYYPFRTVVSSGFDDPTGTISVSYITSYTDTIGYLGDDTALTRIYFVGDSGGTCHLNITLGELKQVGEDPYYPPTYDGWISVDRVMSAIGSGPIEIDLSDPVCTMWHELHPNYCHEWHLTSWEDTQEPAEPGYEELSECDQIDMTDEAGWKWWFHVDEITITVHWDYKEPNAADGTPTGEPGAGEPAPLPEWGIPAWDPDLPPTATALHEIYPTYCRGIYINNWVDNDDSNTLTPSDQMEIMYTDDYSTWWVHITGISTDMWVSEKPIPPEPPEAEFPIGVGLMIAIAPVIPIIYLWRSRKKVVA